MIGEFVIVRTYSAGVHVGVLAECCGTAAKLTNARRVWRWRGARTLHELSLAGCDEEYSRISDLVPEILLTEAIEVIPCTATATVNLSRSRWGV